MAGTVATKILLRLQATRKVALNGATQSVPASVEGEVTWPTGSGASQADEVWVENAGSVGAGLFDNLDLKALAQIDEDADTERTIDLANVKAILIVNTSSSGSLTIGGGVDDAGGARAFAGATNYPFVDDSDKSTLVGAAGAYWFWSNPAGGTVTNDATDILCLGGVGSTQTYEIIIVGDAA